MQGYQNAVVRFEKAVRVPLFLVIAFGNYSSLSLKVR